MRAFSILLLSLLFMLTFISCKKPEIKACFTTDQGAFGVKDTITFNLNCSENPTTSMKWDFGDGTFEESRDLVVKHGYVHSGEYKVTLTICEHAMWYKLSTRCDQVTELITVNP